MLVNGPNLPTLLHSQVCQQSGFGGTTFFGGSTLNILIFKGKDKKIHQSILACCLRVRHEDTLQRKECSFQTISNAAVSKVTLPWQNPLL